MIKNETLKELISTLNSLADQLEELSEGIHTKEKVFPRRYYRLLRERKYGPPSPKTIYRMTERPESRYTTQEEGEGSDLYRTSRFSEAARIRNKVRLALKKLREKNKNNVSDVVKDFEEDKDAQKPGKPITFEGELPDRRLRRTPVTSWEPKEASTKERLIDDIINIELDRKIIASHEINAHKSLLSSFSEDELNEIKNFIANIQDKPDTKVELGDNNIEVDLTKLFMENI